MRTERSSKFSCGILYPIVGTLLLTGSAAAQIGPGANHLTFTTLGTMSGPVPTAHRSEPANLVRYGSENILLDVGDGTTDQLAKVGIRVADVRTIIISHLHFDHIGGMFALLSERYQSRSEREPLTIYGPPGTKRTVARLYAAMEDGLNAVGWEPQKNYTVIEVSDGSKFSIGGVAITAAQNSHYSTLRLGPEIGPKPVSLSYRFDTPVRSICFTGDTGPSADVERLCRNVDLLVSEISYPADQALVLLKRARPDFPPEALLTLLPHFTKEHLPPDKAGLLALHCNAKSLVLTHNALDPAGLSPAKAAIAANYKGQIIFAEDLEVF